MPNTKVNSRGDFVSGEPDREEFVPMGERNWTLSPGEILEMILEERDLTVAQLSETSGIAVAELQSIIASRTEITEKIAEQLGKALELPTWYWVRHQARYLEDLKRLNSKPPTS